jgi:type IV secretion system protein VirB9
VKKTLIAPLLLSMCGAAVASEDLSKLPLEPFGSEKPKIIKPGAMFKETKLVSYEYDPNRTYPVRSRVNVYTEVMVPDGESIVAYYPSADAERGWPYVVSGDKKRVFVMPVVAGAANTATLVTDKRSYLLAFESNGTGEWYQRVRWTVPQELSATGLAGKPFEEFGDVDQPLSGGMPAFDKMNFGYRTEGSASFAPSMVNFLWRSRW